MDILTSRISIPVNLYFIKPITTFAGELSYNMGFKENQINHIQLALEEILVNVIEYGYGGESQEPLEVIFELHNKGLIIRIMEKGMPFSEERLPNYDREEPDKDFKGPGLGLHLVKSMMDETKFIRKGRQGQEIYLAKYLSRKHIHNKLATKERITRSRQAPARKESSKEYEIRPMQSDEAVEVTKCAYKSYGYTYLDLVYYPERLEAMNNDGDLHSIVAVTKTNKIIGHTALKFPYPNAPIAEMAMGFVDPEYRRSGLGKEFCNYCIDYAQKNCLKGLLVRPITSHGVSQHTILKFGFKDCGLFLGVFPRHMEFKKLAKENAQRESLLSCFMGFEESERRYIYLPLNYESIVDHIFRSLEISTHLGSENDVSRYDFEDNTHMEVNINSIVNVAEIFVSNYGYNTITEIQFQLNELCSKQVEIIHLVLNLEDPKTEQVIPAFEKLGFFFASIIPYGLAGCHALILQYLNNVQIDYTKINIVSTDAAMIMNFISEQQKYHNA